MDETQFYSGRDWELILRALSIVCWYSPAMRRDELPEFVRLIRFHRHGFYSAVFEPLH
jgi:hypothetical protein